MILYYFYLSKLETWNTSHRRFPFQEAVPHFRVETGVSHLSESCFLAVFCVEQIEMYTCTCVFALFYPSDVLCGLSEKLYLLEK